MTKVCVASGKRGQAAEVLSKIIDDLKPQSPELCAEINDKDTRMNGAEAKIVFHNSSVIKVVTASDSARGNRCHVLLLDEYRLISKNTIDTILRKFLTLRRMPKYEELTEEERRKEYNKEKNLTLYLSSAYWKDHWSYTKCTDTFKAMLSGNRRQFVCGFPYQLSLNEGLLDPEMVEDEMSESDFSDVLWSINISVLLKPIEPDCLSGVLHNCNANRGTLSVIHTTTLCQVRIFVLKGATTILNGVHQR